MNKLELSNKQNKIPVPELNSIVRIVGKPALDIMPYKNFWGVVVNSGEFSCDVRVTGATLKSLHPQYVFKCITLNDCEPETAMKLLDRLDKILESKNFDYLIKILLNAIATGIPELTEWEQKYLEFTEKVITDYGV